VRSCLGRRATGSGTAETGVIPGRTAYPRGTANNASSAAISAIGCSIMM
jgi:hypothetical protein